MTALAECSTLGEYHIYDPKKLIGYLSKNDYLAENLPLVLFCAERIADQCQKNLNRNKQSKIAIQELSEKLFDDLVTLEAMGVQGLHVTMDMKDRMKDIMKTPAFSVVLDRDFRKKNISLSSISYKDKKGNEAKVGALAREMIVEIKEKTK